MDATLTPAEQKTYEALIRLGDSPELALKTVIENRPNEAKKETSKEFYRKAYTD